MSRYVMRFRSHIVMQTPTFPFSAVLDSRMTLLHSHGRTSSRCSSFTLHVSISASRVSCCGRARHQRYATIAAEDITPDKPPPPPLRNPFPFPKNSKPTPHQIFHLPFNATQAQIKKRCKQVHPFSLYHTCTYSIR